MEHRGFTKRRVINLAAALTLLAAGCSSPGGAPPTGAPTEPMAAPAVAGPQAAIPAFDPATTTIETLWTHPIIGPLVRKHATPDTKIVFIDPSVMTPEWMESGLYPKGTIVLPKRPDSHGYRVQGHPGGETITPNCDYVHQSLGTSVPSGDLVFAGVIYGLGAWRYRYSPEATDHYWFYNDTPPRTEYEWWHLTTCWNGPRPSAKPSATPSGTGSGGPGEPSPTPTPCPSGPISLEWSGYLSPNGDTRHDTLSGIVTAPGDWELVVEGIGKVKSGQGSQSVTWDGKVESGSPVADGTYTVTLKTCAGTDAETVVVDTQDPQISNVQIVPGEPIENSSNFSMKASASWSDLGLAGINRSTAKVKASGAYVSGTSEPVVSGDGSSVTFDVILDTLAVRKAYRVASTQQAYVTLQISVEDNAGNNIGAEKDFTFELPAQGLLIASGKPGETESSGLILRRLIAELVVNAGLHKVFDPDSHENSNPPPRTPAEYDRVLEDILATAIEEETKSARTYIKAGGYSQALADFKKLAGHLQPSTNEPNRIVVNIPDWGTVNVRSYSTHEGFPTLHIQFPKGRKDIKIRYAGQLS